MPDHKSSELRSGATITLILPQGTTYCNFFVSSRGSPHDFFSRSIYGLNLDLLYNAVYFGILPSLKLLISFLPQVSKTCQAHVFLCVLSLSRERQPRVSQL